MRLTCRLVVPVMLCLNLLSITCDPVIYPYDAQTVQRESRYSPIAYRDFYPMDSYTAQSRMHHMRAPPSNPNYDMQYDLQDTGNSSFTFGDFLRGISELDNHQEEARTADFEEFPSYLSILRTPGLSKHGQSSNSDHIQQSTPATYTKTAPTQDNGVSVSFLKPDWSSVTKPANTNMSNKWSGLLQLVMAFVTGSKPGNLEFKGFKDIIISGLVRPLLVAKGGIKSFISKITIPLLSLVLINIEVLVTVWWLWEDCPKETKIESGNPESANNYTAFT